MISTPHAVRALATAVVTAVLSAVALLTPATALAAQPRASLTDIEDEVMCVACHTPLAVSESPQANSERDFIRALIARGQTKDQIKRALVAQYGSAVLALPRAHGFNLTVYILPPALLAIGVVMLVIALPRWRTRSRAAPAAQPSPTIDPADARRLEEDLARYE